ncbi:hypothetical protein BCR44DRAFT_1501242 [Catenaria anguillulae PL171]|uniref:CUE domain-containing protein n=1 Tax=Catenaria anguillulae PL171 TaxID=765915 RepID=A0A1Y2HFH0_9FUNG|nr:hypothetical protein BCR44DRAFT_1501242 [Catenaria anguillulae PL171]
MSMDNVTLFFVLVMVFAAASFFSGGGSNAPRPSRAPRPVSEEMISQVLALFPDADRAAVRADLAQTGSVEATVDRILAGRLRPAPASAAPSATSSSSTSTSTSATVTAARNRTAPSSAHLPAAAAAASASAAASAQGGPRNWHSWIRNPELAQRRAAMVEASRAKFLAGATTA